MLQTKTISGYNENKNANHDGTAFELLYDKYAPKVFGFLMKEADTKEQAEEFLINVFLRVWGSIKNFDQDAEKEIVRILLLECKSINKNKHAIES